MRKAKRVLAAVLGVTLAAGMGILTGCSEKKKKF